MQNQLKAEKKVKKGDIIRLTINIIPVYFLVTDIKDGIPQIQIMPYFTNNVIGTEYQYCAIAPLRENQEYSIFTPNVLDSN